MADYHSVLSRAVGSLPENTAAGRRAIYDKARNALVRQLETIQPPLPPAEIAKQRLALEEAVRRIEGETARAALTVGRPTAPPRAAPPPPAEPKAPPEPKTTQEPKAPPRAAADLAAAPPPRPEPPRPAEPARPEPRVDAPARREPSLRSEPASADAARPEAPHPETAQTEPSVAAAAEPVPTKPRGAPNEVDARREPPALGRPTAPSMEPVVPPPAPDAPGEPLDDLLAPAAAPERPARKRRRLFGKDEPEAGGEAEAGGEDVEEGGRRGRRRRKPQPANDSAESPFDENGEWVPGGDVDVRPAVRRRIRRRRSLAPLIAAAVAAVIVVGAVAAAYVYRDAILAMIDTQLAEPAAPAVPAEEPAEPAPKGSDRLPTATPAAPPAAQTPAATQNAPAADTGSRSVPTTRVVTPPDDADGAAAPGETILPASPTPDQNGGAPGATAPGAAAPQNGAAAPPAVDAPASAAASGMTGPSRSILYEEGEIAGTKGAALNGSSKWEMVRESIGGGAPEPIVRATIEVPERSVTTTIIIRRNRDEALPASHLIEVAFELPVNFPAGGITNLPGMIMKTTEGARGDALIGASARVSDGLFWIALSSSEADQKVNIELLRDRGWIDLPILYNNGRRAILTIEKGSEGATAVNAAIDAWAKEK